MKRSKDRGPIKTTRLAVSDRGGERATHVEVYRHFAGGHTSRSVGVESFPFIVDSEPEAPMVTTKRKRSRPIRSRPVKQPSPVKSMESILTKASVESLDRKVQLINAKISAMERDLEVSFPPVSQLQDVTHNSPASSFHVKDIKVPAKKDNDADELLREIADYRRALKGTCLPKRIEDILSRKNKHTVSVQCDPPRQETPSPSSEDVVICDFQT